MAQAVVLQEPQTHVNIKSSAISIGVDIGRGIFQHYFTPTAFKKFDRDHKIDDILEALFWENPRAIKLLEEKGTDLQRKITKRNTTAILLGKPRVDFEAFIAEELGGKESPAYEVFKVFLDRMEWFEQEAKDKILEDIESETPLSDDDYLFILELFAFKRFSRRDYRKFQQLYKYIRNTDFRAPLIIASIQTMRSEEYAEWLKELVKDKGTNVEKAVLSWFN